ncbi:hypothetical protein C8F01DRAFT_1012105 [Mycena amicta]|nr:hypothetical protein C8F01DRAFT_1012105 [Mycena amicta]
MLKRSLNVRYTSRLSAQPWQFPLTGEGPVLQHRTAAARFNLRMVEHANNTQFPECFAVAAEMKAAGILPSKATYNTLLRSLAHGGHASATLAVLEDMLAMHIQPDVNSFNSIVEAHRTEGSPLLHAVLRRMKELDVPPNATTYTHLILRFAEEHNLEVCLTHLHEMKAAGLVPQLAAIQKIIVLAANQGFPKLAIDIAVSYEESTRKVEDSVWLACLHASAAQLYAEGVTKAWYILVKDLAMSPDEGLCLLVLHTAARNGLPDLATDAMRILKLLGVPWEEHHIAPLFEACFRAGRYEEAFSSLTLMRQNGITPTTQTAYPVVAFATAWPDVLEEFWAILKRMKTENKTIDPTACAALLQACVATQPLSRAFADHDNLTSLGVEPNLETFSILLDGCMTASNPVYGELAFQQAKLAGVERHAHSLGRMITLHLSCHNYDDAFRYLDLLHTSRLVADRQVYEALALEVAASQDARYLFAIDALKSAKYIVHPMFLDQCLNYYRGRRDTEPVRRAVGLDPAAQKFIETGGSSR